MARRFTKKQHLVFLKTCFAVVVAAVFFGMASPLFGYVLQGPHLLKLMTENLGRAKNLVVHQTLLIFDPTTPGAFEEVSETLSYRFPAAFRSDSRSDRLSRIHVDTIEDSITVYDGKISLNGDELFDRYKDLLLFRSRVLLQERLSGWGVDPAVTSFGRYEQEPVIILGARYPDESIPQVWIDKETFRPIRWLIPQLDMNSQVTLYEFRYLQWEQHHKMWYPMKIQCYQGEQLIREMLVDQLSLADKNSEDLFNVEYLKMRYALQETPAQETPASDTQDDIQKMIEDFKKRYE